MAMADTTTLAAKIQAVMQREVEALRAEALFYPGGPLHDMIRVADLTNTPGITGQFPKAGSLTALDTVEGSKIASVQSRSVTSVSVTATEKQIMSGISQLAIDGLVTPNQEEVFFTDEAREHIVSHAAKVDDDMFALASSLTSGVSDTGAALEVNDIIGAVKTLREANVKGRLVGVISEHQWYDLMTQSSSALADGSKSGTVGETLWNDYVVRHFLGVDWFMGDIAGKIDATDDWGFIFGRGCFAMTLKRFPGMGVNGLTVEYDHWSRSYEISSVSSWGVGVLDATRGAYLRTGTN